MNISLKVAKRRYRLKYTVANLRRYIIHCHKFRQIDPSRLKYLDETSFSFAGPYKFVMIGRIILVISHQPIPVRFFPGEVLELRELVERTVNPDVPHVMLIVRYLDILRWLLFLFFVFREQIPIVEWVVLQSENV